MCDPVTIGAIVTSVIGTGTSVSVADRAESKANKAADKAEAEAEENFDQEQLLNNAALVAEQESVANMSDVSDDKTKRIKKASTAAKDYSGLGANDDNKLGG